MKGAQSLPKRQPPTRVTPAELRRRRIELISHRYYFYQYLYSPALSYDAIMLRLESEFHSKAEFMFRFVDADIVTRLRNDNTQNGALQSLFPHLNWQI